MKKNNIKQLKEIVNNEIFFGLSYQGVQAYNISANEYEVITGFWKCNGRYYFVDRNNNKYLASRYDRAEFIAGEMLEQKARENKMINEYIDSIEKSGEVKVVFELIYEYINTCEARGIDSGELVAEEEDAAGETYNVYRRESAADEQNNEQSEETARTAGRYARIAWRWLNTRHLFGDDSEAVTLTGWQYLGVAAVAIVCGLLFSIKF